MDKSGYIKHYTRKNKRGQAQLTDEHILMVHRTMLDNDSDPIYKPFPKSDNAISTAKEAGWQIASKGMEPTELKKTNVVGAGQTVVDSEEYKDFLAFKAAKARKENPEYSTESEVVEPEISATEPVANTPFKNVVKEVKK